MLNYPLSTLVWKRLSSSLAPVPDLTLLWGSEILNYDPLGLPDSFLKSQHKAGMLPSLSSVSPYPVIVSPSVIRVPNLFAAGVVQNHPMPAPETMALFFMDQNWAWLQYFYPGVHRQFLQDLITTRILKAQLIDNRPGHAPESLKFEWHFNVNLKPIPPALKNYTTT
jgi:hypothetical protein